ncbi:hypothetical protein [Pseudomonas lutea]|uniref:hypothetical protein n=1 Tax=Pseudomonas lutea TaxID=243924 RepID=UPI0013633CF5|nr:hypothetical protein [Pseudomonas lutea]
MTKHRAAGRRGDSKTERDSEGARAWDCSDGITGDSDIVFIVENASRRFSSRSWHQRHEAGRNGHKSLPDPNQQSFHQPFNYLSCSFQLIRDTPGGGSITAIRAFTDDGAPVNSAVIMLNPGEIDACPARRRSSATG